MFNLLQCMVDDSPTAYVFIQGIKDTNNDYNSIKIINANNSFSKLFKIDLDDYINRNLHARELLLPAGSIDKTLKEVLINKKHSLRRYIKKFNFYLNFEIYNGKNDLFGIRINEVNEETMRLSSVLRNSPFYSWIKDRNGRYVDVNNPYLKLVDKSYEEIIGKTASDIWDPENALKFEDRNLEVMDNNELICYEDYDRLPLNTERYTESSIWPYKDSNNNILGTIGVAVDVTEKKKLLKNIEKNEQNFLDIADNIEEVLLIREGKDFTYISPSFEKIFGEKPDKIYTDPDYLYSYFYEEDISDLINYHSDKVYDSKFRLKDCSNGEKWVWFKSVPITNEHGITIKRVGIIVDITDSKNLEKELDNLRMDFFANLSHELRTPINLIISSLQVIGIKLDDLDSVSRESLEKYLNILGQNGLRLLKLVNNLIDTTKIDSGQFSYNPKNHNIISFIEDICTSVVEFVNEHNISIIFDTNIEEKIIAFDLDNMERIMLNLISNAIKFNKPDGTIEVTINCSDSINISVKDSGVGIPKDKISTVFGRFEQVSTKMKKEREGSGIGLSLVKSLVELNNGTISLSSEINVGSEFIITLPNETINSNEIALTVDNIDDVVSFCNSKTNNMSVEFSDIYK